MHFFLSRNDLCSRAVTRIVAPRFPIFFGPSCRHALHQDLLLLLLLALLLLLPPLLLMLWHHE